MPDSTVVAAHDQPPTGHERPGRRRLALLGVPIIGLIVLSNVGDALAPSLVNSHPLALLAMNARNRNLALVTNSLDPVSYYVVGTLRLLLADPLFFLLGYWYGDTAIHWMEERTKSFGQLLRQMEGWFAKAAYPVVFIAPNQYICLFAGAAGMSVPGFLLANVSGTLVRLFLIRRLGEAFEAPIDDLLELIREYRTPLLVISISLFAFVMVREIRGSAEGLDELADAVEHEEPPTVEPAPNTLASEGTTAPGSRAETERQERPPPSGAEP